MTHSPRIIAIGDIHGYSRPLASLLNAIQPRPDDTIVTLGDYVDRGPDSRGVIEMLLALERHCRLVPILGNHDEMMRDIAGGQSAFFDNWLNYGGTATLASYDCADPSRIPPTHLDFLARCRDYYETERHFFVHGNYWPTLPLSQHRALELRWESLRQRIPGPHVSGKIAVLGHTAQKNGEILDLGYLKCIDTYCYGGGWLTALDVADGTVWQADQDGRLRA